MWAAGAVTQHRMLAIHVLVIEAATAATASPKAERRLYVTHAAALWADAVGAGDVLVVVSIGDARMQEPVAIHPTATPARPVLEVEASGMVPRLLGLITAPLSVVPDICGQLILTTHLKNSAALLKAFKRIPVMMAPFSSCEMESTCSPKFMLNVTKKLKLFVIYTELLSMIWLRLLIAVIALTISSDLSARDHWYGVTPE